MRNDYKQLIKEALAAHNLQAENFTSLQDYKAVHTSAGRLGFYGTVSGKSWEQVYKKIQAEFKS